MNAKVWAVVFTAAILTVILNGCGYIGPPQYPALNIPVRVNDLSAVERGNELMVYFTVPAITTEGLAITSSGPIELRIGPNNEQEFKVERWAERAVRVAVPAPAKPGVVEQAAPLENFIGQEVIVAVRIANAKGRFSDWSNLYTLAVIRPLSAPAGFEVENVREGVHLKWSDPDGASFRILRRTAPEPQPVLLGTTDKAEYLDSTTSYGKLYEYWVEAVQDKAESVAVGPRQITPLDVFAPAVPSQVTATAGLNAIELSWSRDEETDFKGYRVYRALGGGAFEKVADFVEAPNYSDRQVESGKHYRYAVSAVDQTGNESERSAIVEATAP